MEPFIDPDLLLAHEAIENARNTLQLVRRRKLPKSEAKIVHGLLGPGGERARTYALLPEYALWRQDFERAADDLAAVREDARNLFEKP